jgi:predicted nicotinamide N-methyase
VRHDDSSAVSITDGDSDVMLQLHENIQRNKRGTSSVACHQLIWGRETSHDFLNNKQNQGQGFDVILASDIIYSAVIVEPLWETIQTLLSTNGEFWMGFCAKRKVPIKINTVLEAAERSGFSSTLVQEKEGIHIYITCRKINER